MNENLGAPNVLSLPMLLTTSVSSSPSSLTKYLPISLLAVLIILHLSLKLALSASFKQSTVLAFQKKQRTTG